VSEAPLLSVDALECGYQPGIDILQGLSLAAAEGKLTLVIGPNGAGKSTLLRAIFGFLRPHAGDICFMAEPTLGLEPYQVKQRGMSFVPQELNSFPGLTVEENLRMGCWTFRRDKARLAAQLEKIYGIFPALAERRRSRAGDLSGGQGRMLAIARELMASPALLLIDEPTVGLAPNLVTGVYEILAAARSVSGAAILLVEQNVEQALPLAEHVYLLNLGRVKAEGPGREFSNARVRALVQECLLS